MFACYIVEKRKSYKMNETHDKPQYYIFMDSGERLYLLGTDGKYETDISEAISFDDKLDAIIYVEKHGFDKIASIRQVIHKA